MGRVVLTGALCLLAVLGLANINSVYADSYVAAPKPKGPTLLLETFEKGMGSWVHSTNSKYTGKMEIVTTKLAESTDIGMKVPDPAKHYGISMPLEKPADPSEGFVFQYEVQLKEGLECGGAYVKLLTHSDSLKLTELDGDTPYSIMFGPDKCGNTNKVHLILRHKSPKTGKIEEKHLLKTPPLKMDKLPHLYTVVLKKDNTYQVLVDGEVGADGSLFEDFQPPINPPAEIDDPSESKPEDWVDAARIDDPDAVKPDDWDEDAPEEIEDPEATMPEDWQEDAPELVDDPEAEMPVDWDEEEDGEWEAPKIDNPACKTGCGKWTPPMIPNPEYKGKWYPPMIDNPEYKGPWKATQIPNPEYYDDKAPLENIGLVGAVAVEIWTMSHGLTFDNIMITTDEEVADDYGDRTWRKKFDAEKLKAAAEQEAKDNEVSLGNTAEKMIRSVLDSSLLAPVKESLEPLFDAATEKFGGFAASMLVIGAPWILLLCVYMLFCTGKPDDTVAETKKTDEPTADDAQDDAQTEDKDEGEESEPKSTESPKPKKRTARAT